MAFPEYAALKDYELEVGMIITKEIRDATEQEGLDAIGAFCILNDFSARNVQYEEMNSTGPCKSKDFASSISNTVVTADEIPPSLYKLKTTVIINGKVAATGSTECFQHSFGAAVAYASKGENVYSGEFIGSGTVVNCCGLENGIFLETGDTIRLEIERLGSLTNTIV
ncbi:fumarylacetoacetate hydrolase family protein [Streptococcus panodentis]|uniref:fumarylacetoacetate hydrolase family protein n=1 Tax=Streptococcus panodentis TaxID=1581472 RepID=UPI0030B841C9